LFPHGHKAFNKIMFELMQLHSDKNKGYAGGGVPLGNFDRVARVMSNYPRFPLDTPAGILLMYVMKHFDRIMWDMCQGKMPSIDAVSDIAVYMTILQCMNADRNAEYGA
jgi:hypothetical protein